MALKKIMSTLDTVRCFPAYLGRTIFPDTFEGVSAYRALVQTLNKKESSEREKAAHELINKLDNNVPTIPEDMGYLIADGSNETIVTDAVDYAKILSEEINIKGLADTNRKTFLVNHRIDYTDPRHEKLLRLATSKEIVAPIAKYFGTMPVLGAISIWYSANNGDEISRSQLYHLDGEDIKQIKCFIPIEEVTEDSGPLTLIPANQSHEIYQNLYKRKAISRRNEKLEDSVVYGEGIVSAGIPLIGKPASLLYVDTSRCYHFGSRPGGKSRLIINLHYYTPFSINMPLWGRKSAPVKISSGIQSVTDLSHLDFSKVRRAFNQNKKMEKPNEY